MASFYRFKDESLIRVSKNDIDNMNYTCNNESCKITPSPKAQYLGKKEKVQGGKNTSSEFSEYFNGFALEKVIRCCPLLSQTHCNIISAMGNLAASTDLYAFKNSYPYIARMTNTSEGTVRRAIAAAVEQGILIKTRTYDSDRMNSSNLYRFSCSFLEKVKQIAIACKEKSVSVLNESPRLRSIAKLIFSGINLRQFRSDHPDQAQSDHSDRTKEKNSKPCKRKKTKCTVKPAASPAVPLNNSEQQGVREVDVFNEMAAAKSRASNQRAKKRYAVKKVIHEKAEAMAKKFAWLKGAPDRKDRKQHNPMAIGNFDGQPTVQTVNEAMEHMKQQGYKSEFEREDWSIPPGFRGA